VDTVDEKQKIRLTVPVIVEGRYDKARLAGVVDAVILTTDGFAVFRNAEKRALIRRLGERGVILLSDSDGGGRLIRSHLKGLLDGIPVYDLYTPVLHGKEPRKKAPSKAGILGVEGVPDRILRELFEKFAQTHPECAGTDLSGAADGDVQPKKKTPVTKALLYELGLNGGPGASGKRAAAAKKLGLPPDMTVNAFCAAADMISDGDELKKIAEEIKAELL
jgi:ribonuclease M5